MVDRRSLYVYTEVKPTIQRRINVVHVEHSLLYGKFIFIVALRSEAIEALSCWMEHKKKSWMDVKQRTEDTGRHFYRAGFFALHTSFFFSLRVFLFYLVSVQICT